MNDLTELTNLENVLPGVTGDLGVNGEKLLAAYLWAYENNNNVNHHIMQNAWAVIIRKGMVPDYYKW